MKSHSLMQSKAHNNHISHKNGTFTRLSCFGRVNVHPERKAVKIAKYGNKKIVVDGITFDSKKEAQRWSELKLLERAHVITNLQRQVTFVLIPKQVREGYCVERACTYKADFVYKANGKTVVEDVKSPITKTREYIIKRKLMLFIHDLEVKEV